MRELRLRQREQEVRLILRRIGAALEQVTRRSPVALDARVVAGGDDVGAEPLGALGERRELQVAVAVRRTESASGPRRTRRTKFAIDRASSNSRSKLTM